MATIKRAVRLLLSGMVAVEVALPVSAADKVAFGDLHVDTPMYSASAVDELISGSGGGITTNDVAAIASDAVQKLAAKNEEPIFIWTGRNVPYSFFGPTNETSFKGPARINLQIIDKTELHLVVKSGTMIDLGTAAEPFDGSNKQFSFNLDSSYLVQYPELLTNSISLSFIKFIGVLKHYPTFGSLGYMSQYYDDVGYARLSDIPPPTSLEPASNYTDSAVSGLRAALTTGQTQVLESKYADEAEIAYKIGYSVTASTVYTADDIAAGFESLAATESKADAALASLATKTTTNDVCNIVTNEVTTYGEWVFHGYASSVNNVPVMQWTGSQWEPCSTNPLSGGVVSSLGASKGDAYSTALEWTAGVDAGSSFSATREIFIRNALGLARYTDLSNATDGVFASISNSLTVGYRRSGTIGRASVSFGRANLASGENSLVAGDNGYATLYNSIALGLSPFSTNSFAFTWNGTPGTPYGSHGNGTMSINPNGGLYGIYIGDKMLYDIFSDMITNHSTRTVTFVDENTNAYTKSFVPIDVATGTELAAITNKMVDASEITNIARLVAYKIQNYVWDKGDETCYRRVINNGNVSYVAVTNIDVTLPANWEALDYLEREENQ